MRMTSAGVVATADEAAEGPVREIRDDPES